MIRRIALVVLVGLSSATGWGEPVTALVFAPDGGALLSNGAKAIVVRSAKNADIQKTVPCSLGKITALAFRRQGDLLAVSGGTPGVSGEVQLLAWPSLKLLQRFTNHTDLATAVAFDPTGMLLGIASADHLAWVHPVTNAPLAASSNRPPFLLKGHSGPVLALAFSPSGRTVVTASADRSLKVWSTENGELLRSFNQHAETVHTLVFRPYTPDAPSGAAYCASGGDDRTVRIWQPEIGRMVRIIRHHEGSVFALAYSAEGASLYSAGKEGIIRRLDAESDQILHTWPARPDWIYSLALSPDGSQLAAGEWSGAVSLTALPLRPVK
jgi:WD40 repeat protein